MIAEVLLEIGIQHDVARIIEEEVELDLVYARTLNIEGVERATVGRNRLWVGGTSLVLPTDRVWRQQAAKRLAVVVGGSRQ